MDLNQPHIHLGRYITSRRLKANLSRKYISDCLDCSEQFYGRCENGDVGLPLKHAKILLEMSIVTKGGIAEAMMADYKKELDEGL